MLCPSCSSGRLVEIDITLQERRRFGEPSLTNIVRIVSSEWKLWLRSVENSGPAVGSADVETLTNRALESEAGLAISRARYHLAAVDSN